MTTRDPAPTMCGMAVKAIVVDGENVQHLIIGLNRDDVESLLRGEVFTLPSGQVPVLTFSRQPVRSGKRL